MIKCEHYGGGLRWYCTKCDARNYVISWTNSAPPPFCKNCGADDEPATRESALAAVKWLKKRYQERAVFPGSIRAISNLCEKHKLIPNGIRKTHFARVINDVTGE